MAAPIKAKVPPNSREAEMMVLGCMLTSINSLNVSAEHLSEGDFYFAEHKIIFRCLQDAYASDKPADVHIIAEELKRQEKLQLVGGVVYLTSLAQYSGTSAYIEEYAEIVKNKSILRQMVETAQIVEKTAYDEPGDVDCALDDAQQLFFRIGQTRNTKAGLLIRDILEGSRTSITFLKELEARQERFMRLGPSEVGITGIPTGFVELDRMINGLNNSHLVILASRPGMGKTAYALNIAANVSFKCEVPVGIFSLEMTAEQLVHRIVCFQAEVESSRIQTGSLSTAEFHQVVESVHDIEKHTIIIDDQPGLKITDLRARARRMKECHKVGCIIIDYLQLISGSGSAKTIENRQNEISEISRMLKILARELDVPILCLSQLSRKVEERTGHRPLMSDLRESGCLLGDTVIRDAITGQKYSLQQLAQRPTQTPIHVHALNEDGSISVHLLSKAFPSGSKVVYELQTSGGHTISASGNHPFYTRLGWVRLDALKEGDEIALPRRLAVVGSPQALSEAEVVLLGHFLLRDRCLVTAEADLQRLQKAFFDKFGQGPKVIREGGAYMVRAVPEGHGSMALWHASAIAHKEGVLEAIATSPDDQVCLFLRCFWATEGSMGHAPDGSPELCCSITGREAAEAMRFLLLRLGIQSSLEHCPASGGAPAQWMRIHIKDPVSQGTFFARVAGFAPAGSAKEATQSSSDTLWEQIYVIRRGEEAPVFDATVDGVHNFVANGFCVHNSIEQDADVVLFLLRREYYDPYDRPGQAELIVAKNRHGGVGSVTLAYRKELAQFANFCAQDFQGLMGGDQTEVSGFGPSAGP